MPSLDELMALAPWPDPSMPEPTSYEDVRPYLRPSLFEALRPHVEEFERRMALRNAPSSVDASSPGAAPPAAYQPGLLPSLETTPEPRSYEDVRPYLRPSLFEALRPHVEEFERRMALRNAPSSLAAPSPGSPPSAGYQQGPVLPLESTPEPRSYEDVRPYLRPSLFEALKPHVAAFEQTIASRAGALGIRPAASVPEPAPSSYETASLPEGLTPQGAQWAARHRQTVVGPLATNDPPIVLASLQGPADVAQAPASTTAYPSPDPWPPAPPLTGGTTVAADLTAPTLTSPATSSEFSTAAPDPGAGRSMIAAPARSSAVTSPSQEFPPGDADPLTNNTVTDVTPDGRITSEVNDQGEGLSKDEAHEEAAAQETFARNYEVALTAIEADPVLRHEVWRIVEKAGDTDFQHRLATIIAGLHQNRGAALDAIRAEAFNARVRNLALGSGPNFVADGATSNVFERLAEVLGDSGVAEASRAGASAAVNMGQEPARLYRRIINDPNLSPDQRTQRLAEYGFHDLALAAGAMALTSPAYRGGLLAPAGRPGPSGAIGAPKVPLTGQIHHPISKSIHEALEGHPNLKGAYRSRDRRFETQAVDYDSHHGYQDWHRLLDAEVSKYIAKRPSLTPHRFESWLRGRYGRSDLKRRFPNKF